MGVVNAGATLEPHARLATIAKVQRSGWLRWTRLSRRKGHAQDLAAVGVVQLESSVSNGMRRRQASAEFLERLVVGRVKLANRQARTSYTACMKY